MFKKIVSAALIMTLALSLAGCFGGGGGTLDEVSKDEVVRIEDFLDEASSYFQLADSSLIIADTKAKNDVLDAYVDAATSLKELPKELVDSYVNSFKAGIDESAEDEEITKIANSLIKEELVIHLAYTALKCDEITDEMRSDMAKKIAAELDCDVAAIYTPGNNTYTVDTAVKEELVKAKLETAWENTHGAESSKAA